MEEQSQHGVKSTVISENRKSEAASAGGEETKDPGEQSCLIVWVHGLSCL